MDCCVKRTQARAETIPPSTETKPWNPVGLPRHIVIVVVTDCDAAVVIRPSPHPLHSYPKLSYPRVDTADLTGPPTYTFRVIDFQKEFIGGEISFRVRPNVILWDNSGLEPGWSSACLIRPLSHQKSPPTQTHLSPRTSFVRPHEKLIRFRSSRVQLTATSCNESIKRQNVDVCNTTSQ
jgi:hypothetical protein